MPGAFGNKLIGTMTERIDDGLQKLERSSHSVPGRIPLKSKSARTPIKLSASQPRSQSGSSKGSFKSEALAPQLTTRCGTWSFGAKKLLRGRALLWGKAMLQNKTLLRGRSLLWGNALLWGTALLRGEALLRGKTLLCGETLLQGHALVWAKRGCGWRNGRLRGKPCCVAKRSFNVKPRCEARRCFEAKRCSGPKPCCGAKLCCEARLCCGA